MLRFPLRSESKQFSKIIATLQQRLDLATRSLEKISDGSFNIDLPHQDDKLLDGAGKAFYQTLTQVREKLAEYAQLEDERKWIAEGMDQFMLLMSGRERTKGDFYDQVLKFLVRYTDGNQGGIFLVNTDDHSEPFLELTACYAFGKRKFEQKRVAIGQGMLGQCYLEKQTSYLSQVPPNYTKITSGLGEATPTFLIMLPLRYDQEVLGVTELAYFKKLEPHKITFLEKIAESLAAVTLNDRHANRAQMLFEESQRKASILQQQEETLRQNVEELMATQEEMKRQQLEIQGQSELMKFIIDNVPFPIFVKDDKGRYCLVNKAESKLFNLDDKDVIGKDDRHFVSKEEEWDVIRKSDQAVLESNQAMELPLQQFTTVTGKSYIFKTTKIPFINPVSGAQNILGVSIDLTEKLSLEKKLHNEKRINQNNLFINIAGRQRMLSQKIGFYCETLIRGKVQLAGLLRDAIELHEHSLQVLRNGGHPMGISSDNPLPPLHDELLPEIKDVELIWAKYKAAAEKILCFCLSNPNTRYHTPDTDASIIVIEENGEILLNAHNNFMLAYIEKSTAKLNVF